MYLFCRPNSDEIFWLVEDLSANFYNQHVRNATGSPADSNLKLEISASSYKNDFFLKNVFLKLLMIQDNFRKQRE